MFKPPEPKADRTDGSGNANLKAEKMDFEEPVSVNETDEEYLAPVKQRRKSRRREKSTSRSRVTRSKKSRPVDDDPDWND